MRDSEIKAECNKYRNKVRVQRDELTRLYEENSIQKAEIEALINGQETLQKHIAEQQAEIEILIRKKESLRDEICELQSEIERLKEFEYMYNSLLK